MRLGKGGPQQALFPTTISNRGWTAGAASPAAMEMGLPIAPESRANVILNYERSLMIARPLLEVELDDELTPGPVFRP